MTPFVEIVITTSSEQEGKRLAEILIEKKLAACVQISGPIRSTYTWKGRLETSKEWLCTVKTRISLFDLVAQTIRENHSYDCPQIIAVPILAGTADYLDWLDEVVPIVSD
ncbi:MAG: divalent-cation tolerance protein CutA [Thermoguttaceae bacterium]